MHAMSQALYILDAHSMIFQVYHAIPEMTGPAGQPTNAVFGFTRDILNLLRNRQPDYLICTFDGPGPTVRHAIYPQYKAQRAEMPEDLRPQIAIIREVLDGFHIPIVEMEGQEADDLIATTANQAVDQGLDVLIVTGDKDARQLINDQVRIFNVRTGEVFDAESLVREWGVRPEQVVDLLALAGDSVDNVPGVPGIGIKTAAKLLQQYGTLEGVLEHVEEIPGAKRREQLRAAAEQLQLNRRLIRLEPALPLEIDWEACRVDSPDRARLLELFSRLGFRRFAREVGDVGSADHTLKTTCHVVESLADLRGLVERLSRQRRFGIEVFASPGRPMEVEVLGFAFCWQPGEAWFVSIHGENESMDRGGEEFDLFSRHASEAKPDLSEANVWSALRPVLEDPQIDKLGGDLKSLCILARRAGIEVRGLGLDTMVASYLLDAGAPVHDLDQLSSRHLQHVLPVRPELAAKEATSKSVQERAQQWADYAGQRADAVLRLADILIPQLHDQGLGELYQDLERPLIEVLAEMEFTGVRIDVPFLRRLSQEYAGRLAEIEQETYRLAGHPFNIGSPPQLRQVLFEELGLKSAKRTGTGAFSTDQEVLGQLAAEHPLPALLLEHRKLAKLKSTYIDSLPQLVNSRTGRVHASFNQGVTATGRLSSSDPNLQNIPVRSEEGRQIRQAFVPGPDGWQLLTADYSQIQLRLLAHLSGDAALRRAFEEEQDIHAFVAAQLYRVSPESVTAEMRRTAKMVNFGIVYGISPFGLASRLGISAEEAAAFIDAYFERHPGVEEFSTKTLELCRENGYVKTILGRCRTIRGIRPVLSRQRNLPERTAINTVIQGSEADLIKQAMVAIHRCLHRQRLSGQMLLQVHDELVFEVPPEELNELASLVKVQMTTALPLDVPITVDIAYGPNWLDVQPLAGLEG